MLQFINKIKNIKLYFFFCGCLFLGTDNNNQSPTSLSRPETPKRKTKQDFVFELFCQVFKKFKILKENDKVKFEDVESLLKNRSIVELFARFWTVLSSYVNQKRLEKGKMINEIRQTRIILSCLMIFHFPQDVLDAEVNNMNLLSQRVYDNAKNVVEKVLLFEPIKITKLECERIYKIITNYDSKF